jgi:hypothetical protein
MAELVAYYDRAAKLDCRGQKRAFVSLYISSSVEDISFLLLLTDVIAL